MLHLIIRGGEIMKPVVIFGTGEVSKCVYFYLTNDSEHKIAGFTSDRNGIKNNTFQGLPVIPFDEVQIIFPPDQFDMFIAIGYQGLNSVRTKKFQEAKEKGYKLISYVCSKSTVWGNLHLGENCFIGENNIIQPFVTIEDNVFMWSGNSVAHDSRICKNCFIAACAVIAGDVEIGENCFIGINSTVREAVKVARNCTIGANSYIARNTRENETYISEPTKPSRISKSMLQYMKTTRQR
jgi:sugar O-acyltransferase (sialic acid O-acetyltransferase NeuD family)